MIVYDIMYNYCILIIKKKINRTTAHDSLRVGHFRGTCYKTYKGDDMVSTMLRPFELTMTIEYHV